jgi:hypothetical protein
MIVETANSFRLVSGKKEIGVPVIFPRMEYDHFMENNNNPAESKNRTMKILKQILKCRQEQMAAQKKRQKLGINFGNHNGYILFSLLLVGVLIMCIAMGAFSGLRSSMKTAGNQRIKGNAFNIAEAGKEHAIALLRLDSVALRPNLDSVILSNVPFDVGSYTVRLIANAPMDTLVLRSMGMTATSTSTIEVITSRYHLSLNEFKGTIMSRSLVNLTGNIAIDGQDWDSSNAAVIGPGTLGIYTCDTVSCGGNSAVGGMGIAPPSKGAAPGSVQTHADTATFFRSPESVLGVDSGALDKYKSLPTSFYTCDSITYWESFPYSTLVLSGGGILICHDTGYSTILKNIHGSFKGIIIADKIDHLNANMAFLGAIITLSKDPAGNAYGNGTPKVRYCSQILKKVLKRFSMPTIQIVSWKEL